MKPCRHKETIEGCRICWLYVSDERYKKLWDGVIQPSPAQVKIPVPANAKPCCGKGSLEATKSVMQEK
jgi:hypothetical protein